jgi:hypothetical protein
MALHTWLGQRKLTLAMLGELAKNAKAAGWQRPLVSLQLSKALNADYSLTEE